MTTPTIALLTLALLAPTMYCKSVMIRKRQTSESIDPAAASIAGVDKQTDLFSSQKGPINNLGEKLRLELENAPLLADPNRPPWLSPFQNYTIPKEEGEHEEPVQTVTNAEAVVRQPNTQVLVGKPLPIDAIDLIDQTQPAAGPVKNINGDRGAADRFTAVLKQLMREKSPFEVIDMTSLKNLINGEIDLSVANWIFTEEVASDLAATFGLNRSTAAVGLVMAPDDVDQMRIGGSDSAAAKLFQGRLLEMLQIKSGPISTDDADLLTKLSDSLLRLLAKNGVVKEQFAEDIAAELYRVKGQHRKLFV